MTTSEITQFEPEMIAGCPPLLNVGQSDLKLLDWAEDNKERVEQWLRSHGALLIRGLHLSSSKQFGKLLSTLFMADLLPYEHRSTPRTELRGNVYTATEYHSDQLIVQHNEQAYTNVWPMRIGFFCLLPSQQGGQTPIADSRVIYRKIPEHIKCKFEDKGIMYVRNFTDIDLPWTEVFNTEDKAQVSAYCTVNDIEYEWLSDSHLRIRQTLLATAVHPHTKEPLWFNQAHLFHASTLNEVLRSALLTSLGQDNLPRNTYYGDGSAIDDDVIATIQEIYQQYKISFMWQKGDVMLLDNMLFSHGREPFAGERRVLTGMAIARNAKR